VKPKYLDYENTQILLIGEGTEENFRRAVEPTKKDQKHDKETPQEELEKLEHEDELRTEHLKGKTVADSKAYRYLWTDKCFLGDDSIFEDLKISKKEYPEVHTTW
jgi:uroporphyrinogen-III synthase